MAGEKRFRSAFFGGFNKSDVAAYMEKLVLGYDQKIREKDEQISNLKTKNLELEKLYIEYKEKAGNAIEDRERIAEILILAKEKADEIIMTAEEAAKEEKRKLEVELEIERERIVEARAELKELRKQALDTMKSFSVQLQDMVELSTVD